MLADGGSSQDSSAWVGVVSALAAVLSALAAVWVPVIAGPRYRLRYGPWKWEQLDDGSWEVQIFLSGRGRRDITREAFDECQPVDVDIGVPIREVTDAVSSPDALRIVKHEIKGTCLRVGPGLIGSHQDLRFTLTTGTAPKWVHCQASLIDVEVRSQSHTPRVRQNAIIGGAFVVFTLVYLLVSLLITTGDVIVIVVFFVIFGALVFFLWFRRRDPDPLGWERVQRRGHPPPG